MIMGEFSGKIVLVTGGSKGIGAATVRRFCEEGAHCIIASRHLEECQSFADELQQAGFSASALAVDVLVNSAGVNNRKYAVDYVEEDWDYIMNINLKGAYFCTVEVGKEMLKQQKGAIISLSSLQSHINMQRLSIYGASKAGIRNFTKGLANEWATKGVRVNCVSPAFIATPLVEKVLQDPSYTTIIDSRTPMKRVGTPDEVANVILFLASDKASYITGADIAIDGGWTAS